MRSQLIESLEKRQLMSAAPATEWGPAPAGESPGTTVDLSAQGPRARVLAAEAAPAAQGKRARARGKAAADPATTALSAQDVEDIIAAAASQATSTQAIVVVDRSGRLLGVWGGSGLRASEIDTLFGTVTGGVVARAYSRALTAAFFQSRENAFTTRTARYIIQNHFPEPIKNTIGGPLYGVQFSSIAGSDIILPSVQSPLGISGDPGGYPLYMGGVPVGGIGVAGDQSDVSPIDDLLDVFQGDPYGQLAIGRKPQGSKTFHGTEEKDFDEAVAKAGAGGGTGYFPPERIKATKVTVDGLRFPFAPTRRAKGQPEQTLAQLSAAGRGQLFAWTRRELNTPTVRAGNPERVSPGVTIAGQTGLFRITSNRGRVDPVTGLPDPSNPHVDPQESDPVIPSNDRDASGNLLPESQRLTTADVMQIIEDAVRQSTQIRALIREPNGVEARVHIAVTDRDGTVLGVFRMEDGTNFSYDVAVQKARTAAFFSDDDHAFTPRAIGFMSQKYFPPAIQNGNFGPLYLLSNKLALGKIDARGPDFGGNLRDGPLPNGITIFAGGAPLYKNGVMVGGVGISGDGVDQDDLIAFAGHSRYQPRGEIRSDSLDGDDAASFILSRLEALETDPDLNLTPTLFTPDNARPSDIARRRIRQDLGEVQLPYLKFPRRPRP